MKQYNLVVCGGTFDHFHKGHEEFLRHVFSVGKKVIVGVTSDNFAGKSKIIHSASSGQEDQRSKIETFEKRKGAVLEFVKEEKALNRIEILEIDDLFGPTLDKNLPIDAIVVSQDSKKGAELINERRKKLGLEELNILIAPQVLVEDGKPISSARIRKGEINREGRLYVNPLWLEKDLLLPEDLTEEFKKPFGELLKEIKDSFENKNSLVITVGDVTTKKFNQLSANQQISVVDFKVARKKAFSSFSDLGFFGDEKIITAENPASHITHDLFSKVLNILKFSFDKRIILKIEGEEDLAVLPLVLAAPLSTIICYGQPNKGIVRVVASEKSKDKAYELISRFQILDSSPRSE